MFIVFMHIPSLIGDFLGTATTFGMPIYRQGIENFSNHAEKKIFKFCILPIPKNVVKTMKNT
jgi:hypothetical protein